MTSSEAERSLDTELEELTTNGEKFGEKEAPKGTFEDDADGQQYSQDEEKSVIRKLDKRVVGLIAGLYMLSFLDRSSMSEPLPSTGLLLYTDNGTDIGNAKIAGLMEDLKLTDSQYEWLLSGFYITYIAFEWMAIMYDAL